MNDATMRDLREHYERSLLEDCLPFWLNHCQDREHGGFLMALDRQGRVIDTDKGVWQQARFTWLLGELHNQLEPRAEWRDWARHGADFLEAHCFDPSDGRMWFHVARDGSPIRKRRYAFTESFAAIAFGELFQASGESRYAERARATFERFVQHSQNPQGVRPKFTETRPTRSLGFPMILIATAQELRTSIGLADANRWIDQGLETIRRFHVNAEHECVLENVGPHGEVLDQHFDGRLLNPGHAIEAAWFVMLEGKIRSDRELVDLGLRMLDWTWARGWDPLHGGILYFVDLKGLPVSEYWHDMKFWWPQNEALIATLLAYQLTGDDKYALQHRALHDWVEARFPDREFGEWFGYLHRDGRVSSTLKGNLWKGPFHLPRMQWICASLLREMA